MTILAVSAVKLLTYEVVQGGPVTANQTYTVFLTKVRTFGTGIV